MHWRTALSEATYRFDGGVRSFPPSRDATFASKYPYLPPNEDYERFFLMRLNAPELHEDKDVPPQSAGWLLPDDRDDTICNPVFIAHSTISAIWLLRETLGDHVLSPESWDSLVRAAQTCTTEADTTDNADLEIPPSAQAPTIIVESSLKRAASLGLAAPSKRTRLDNSRAPPQDPSVIGITPPHSPGPTDDTDKSSPIRVTTVSNNNRRAEQKRIKKLDAAHAKKRASIGLHAPDDKAPFQERAAYNAIAQQDEPTIAWIIKQSVDDDIDFYTASPTPYYTARTMLEKARALGNQSARYYAAQFLQGWREQGSPFLVGTEEVSLLQHPRLQRDFTSSFSQQHANADEAFCFAWGLCDRYDAAMAAVNIGDRWSLALLGAAYVQKQDEIEAKDAIASKDRTRNRYGKGQVRTEAITALMKLCYPVPSKQDASSFRSRLKRASRWHKVIQSLGWGSLLLIPHEDVSNHWLERVLRIAQFEVFLRLVKREQPELCAVSKALETWLGPDGIAGAPISNKQRLSIETEAPSAVYKVEEIPDSEDEAMDAIEDVSHSPIASGRTSSSVSLRQMTLLELFHPIKT